MRTGVAWKGVDWDAIIRLHENGFNSDSVHATKSDHLDDECEREGKHLFASLLA